MNANNLFNELAELGICNSGKRVWNQSSKDIDMIVKVWKRWPEYFIEHSSNALNILRNYIKEDEDISKLEENNIFLDRKMSKTIGSDEAIFIVGDSEIEINLKKWEVARIYCFNTSKLNLICGFHSYVNIKSYDNSCIHIYSENAKGVVYCYDNSNITCEDTNIEVIKKSIERGQVFNGKEINYSNKEMV